MFTKSKNPHEYTQGEMLVKFLTHLKVMRDYWATTPLDPERSDVKARMDGLCFSFLSMLDGCSMDLPSFEVLPTPHPSDEEYLRDDGCDWWPNQSEKLEKSGLKSISGGYAMHELWHAFNRGEVSLVDGEIKVERK